MTFEEFLESKGYTPENLPSSEHRDMKEAYEAGTIETTKKFKFAIDRLNNVNAEFLEKIAKLQEEITKWEEDYICLENLKDNQIKELQEYYQKEYFEIADRTADEKIKELEQYEQEVTIDDTKSYDPNSWGMMHEEMFVPKEAVRDLLKENYALIENQKKQISEAKKILKEYVDWDYGDHTNCLPDITKKAKSFIKE